jgi:hypothetical protein
LGVEVIVLAERGRDDEMAGGGIEEESPYNSNFARFLGEINIYTG